MSDDLVTWLRAAIEARLKLAREAAPHSDGRWWRRETVMFAGGGKAKVGHLYSGEPVTDDDGEVPGGDFIVVYDDGSPSDAEFAHIEANDPQDTIARCEAELAILDEHPWQPGWDGTGFGRPICSVCSWTDRDGDAEGDPYPCKTVRLIGRGYRHWPGYREADWKP